MKKIIKSKKGFTLIELLVVIAIIGLLSSFAVVSLNGARTKARDALRKGDMAQMRTAMNLYYDDHSSFPVCGTFNSGAADFGATDVCWSGTLATALTSGTKPYMAEMPEDPRNQNNDPVVSAVYIYRYASNGTEYAITYRLEEVTDLKVIRGW
ncbi:MAG: prepilin-type N-terminal cleavage/methylation domain-containing protein [Patescibacteria group bacterium]|jgi:prepilin-type N-terminal cleavage/methylation domain-containing protein